MPRVGTAVRLVMAASWRGSGNDVGGPQPRPEDEATPLCEHAARRAARLVRGNLEACTAATTGPCAGHLGVAREGHVGDALDFATAPIQTRTVTSVDVHPAAHEPRGWPSNRTSGTERRRRGLRPGAIEDFSSKARRRKSARGTCPLIRPRSGPASERNGQEQGRRPIGIVVDRLVCHPHGGGRRDRVTRAEPARKPSPHRETGDQARSRRLPAKVAAAMHYPQARRAPR